MQVAPLKLGAIGQDARIRLPGQSEEQREKNPAVNYHQATAGYFQAMGIDLREGRVFAEHESSPVAIVSKNLATRLWPAYKFSLALSIPAQKEIASTRQTERFIFHKVRALERRLTAVASWRLSL